MIDKVKIEDAVKEWIKSTESFLVEVKSSPSKFTIFIDKPSGISIEECIKLNKHLTSLFEVDGVWETHELEVSSPGMDQPLKVPQQYIRRINKEVKVITSKGIEHKGLLKSANNKGFELLETTSRKENKKKIVSEQLYQFEYDQIKETKLILSFKN